MATPIKDTPVLKGRKAEKFLDNVRKNEQSSTAQSQSCSRAKAVYSEVVKKSKSFSF